MNYSYNRKVFLAAIALFTLPHLEGQASTLTVKNKLYEHPIQLFIRGEGSETYYTVLLDVGTTQKDLEIQSSRVNHKPTFEVIASSSIGGDPDWRLLAGKCTNLVVDANHTIIIDSTAGKVSCTNATAENPKN